MTNQPPMELSELMHEFEIEIPLKHRTKFRELCSIYTEKIRRLEATIELLDEQNKKLVYQCNLLTQRNFELESK